MVQDQRWWKKYPAGSEKFSKFSLDNAIFTKETSFSWWKKRQLFTSAFGAGKISEKLISGGKFDTCTSLKLLSPHGRKCFVFLRPRSFASISLPTLYQNWDKFWEVQRFIFTTSTETFLISSCQNILGSGFYCWIQLWLTFLAKCKGNMNF